MFSCVCVYECIIRVWCVFIFSAIEIYKNSVPSIHFRVVCVCVYLVSMDCLVGWLDFHTKFCVAQAKNKSV